MATSIELNAKIDTANSAESLGELRRSLKELIALQGQVGSGSEDFKKLQKAINDTEGKLGDLNDSFNTLKGSGVERLNSSFGLLKDGFANFDAGKIGTAFKGIGAAMKAIPIFLIIEGVTYLIQNFDKLSKGSGPLAKILRGIGDALSYVGDVVGKVIDFFTDLTGATNDATRALEAQGEAIKTSSDKATEAIENQTRAYDQQIAIAKASGKSTVELEKAKQEAIVQTNLAVARQIQAYVAAGGELDEEKRKILTASINAIKAAKVQEKVIELTDQKEKEDAYRKHLEELKKIREEQQKEERQAQDELNKRQQEQFAKNLENYRKTLKDKKDIDDLELAQSAEMEAGKEQIKNLYAEIDAQNAAERRERERMEDLKAFQDKLQTATAFENSIQSLSDIVFTIKSSRLKKGSAEELEAAKKQFEINKALQIATATINGAQAVTAILAVPDFTLGIASGARIAAAGLSTLATIAKIAATKFQGGASGGGASSGGLGASASIAPPVPQSTAFNPATVGQVGGVGAQKVVLVEHDVTRAQKKVKVIESQATFG